MNQTVLEAAKAYHESGISVIPLNANKKPIVKFGPWIHEEAIQTDADIDRLFSGVNTQIGALGGSCSDNLFFLDFDNRTAFRNLIEHSPTLQRLNSITPTVKTKRGVHVYLKAPVPIATKKDASLCLDIKAQLSYVVAPPSRLANGTQYLFADDEWKPIYTIHDLDEIDFIKLTPWAPEIYSPTSSQFDTLDDANPFYGLGNRARRIILGLDIEKGERSEADQKVALQAITAGLSLDELLEIYRRFAGANSKYRDQNQGPDYIKRNYANAFEYYSLHRSAKDRLIDEMAEYYGQPHAYMNRTRSTDAAVARAIFEVARRSGKLEGIYLRVREMAELSGFTSKTITNALIRLPFIVKVGNTYTFTPHVRPNPNTQENVLVCVNLTNPSSILPSGHDAFRVHALGKIGMVLLSTITATPQPSTEIAQKAGIAQKTAWRKLEKLTSIGTVNKTADGYALAKPIDKQELDRIAQELGTAGTARRQKAQHERERDEYQLYKARQIKKALGA